MLEMAVKYDPGVGERRISAVTTLSLGFMGIILRENMSLIVKWEELFYYLIF